MKKHTISYQQIASNLEKYTKVTELTKKSVVHLREMKDSLMWEETLSDRVKLVFACLNVDYLTQKEKNEYSSANKCVYERPDAYANSMTTLVPFFVLRHIAELNQDPNYDPTMDSNFRPIQPVDEKLYDRVTEDKASVYSVNDIGRFVDRCKISAMSLDEIDKYYYSNSMISLRLNQDEQHNAVMIKESVKDMCKKINIRFYEGSI